MASATVAISSASSSGISISNSSSKAMTSSTVSKESAPRSSIKEADSVTSFSSTPSCSTIIACTRSSIVMVPSLPVLEGLSPTHAHDLPGHIPSLVRGQKEHTGCHILWRAEAPEWDVLQQRLPLRVRECSRHICFNEAWSHRIDGNATRPEFLGEGLGKTDKAG